MSKSTSWIWFTASHSAVMPSFIAKVKHRHRFCSATHRIQLSLRKWLASVKRQWAVAVGVGTDTQSQTQCQLYDYRTTTFHLRLVHRIGVQKASQSLRFVNINLLPCQAWPYS